MTFSLKLILVSLVCSCNLSYFSSNAMEKNPFTEIFFPQFSVKSYIMNISSLTIHNLTHLSFLQQSYGSAKPIVLNLISKCYDNPKLVLATILMSYFLYSMKKSTITRSDLQKINKENKQLAQQQFREFTRTHDNVFTNLQKKLAEDFSGSESELNALQACIEQNQNNLSEIPKTIAASLATTEASEDILLQEIFDSAHQDCAENLGRLTQYTLACQQAQETSSLKFFTDFLNQTDNTQNALNTLASKLINALTHETESLYTLLHQQNSQESLQLIQFRNGMDDQYNNLNTQLDSIMKILIDLAEDDNQKIKD